VRHQDEAAASTVVGAIIVLAILGSSLVYVNAFYVPRQGATMEIDARADALAALNALAADTTSARAPFERAIPLAAPAGAPPLLSGLVLSPARAPGSLQLNATRTTLTISHVTDAPPGGVPAGDPMRAAEAGKMRVYDLGNATAGQPLGVLAASLGGTYLEPAAYRLEAGAILAQRANASSLVAAPPWILATSPNGTRTTLAATVPILVGSPVDDRGTGAVTLHVSPAPPVRVGAGQAVYNVTFQIHTDALAAWTAALGAALAGHGTITATPDPGIPDAGTVTMVILPPAGTPAGTRAVTLDVTLARETVDLASLTAS
jgi:hypothetical protein